VNASNILDQLASFARAVSPTLDDKSYYDLLNVNTNSNIPDIRQAYYKVASQLHPDRYIQMKDVEARDKLNTIYARITEGYRVLTDPVKRREYDEALAKGQKRLVTTQRDRKGPKAQDEGVQNPDARRFFRMGVTALDQRDYRGAALNFKLALAYEPTSALIKEKLTQATSMQSQAGPPPAAAKPENKH
jgi:DnaJ-class molecular chaperone